MATIFYDGGDSTSEHKLLTRDFQKLIFPNLLKNSQKFQS